MNDIAILEYVPTRVAAAALMRQDDTLRQWAFTGTGPVKPIRINGRLAWPVDQIIATLTPDSGKPGKVMSDQEKTRLATFLNSLHPDRIAHAIANLSDDGKALVAALLEGESA